MPADYWRLPLAPQGEAPPQWGESERSLSPEACAQCHANQYEDWRTSLHAKALSPGLVGQLVTFDGDQASSCLECHAPLAEQRQDFEAARAANQGHVPARQGLAASGISCPACHLRGHRRFGPPRRGSGAIGPSEGTNPHGGVWRTPWFEKSEFCAACHQFPQELAVNGKPLQNTYAEWQASPQARQGIQCQGCHMPDRRHLWRGIHDPDMVVSGLTARFAANPDAARFELTNSGVGHAFPTYVTPKAVMSAIALDAQGRPRPKTTVSHVIQRRVVSKNDTWIEKSDTRLLPGATAVLEIPWGNTRRVRMWLEIHPDDFYDHDVYDELLRHLPKDSHAARLIAEADARAKGGRFRLFETEIERPAR
jgi:nitrate/TMAO reductase-like tetraheme cytochrome c subunit